MSYEGIRFTAEEIVDAVRRRQPHVIGLSILSGSHVALTKEVMARLHQAGLDEVKVVAGGIIPAADEAELVRAGVCGVFSPKDYDLNIVMEKIVALATS